MRVREGSANVQFEGDVLDSEEFEIDEELGAVMILEMLTKYKDPIGSTVREVTSNAEDSARELTDIQTLKPKELQENYKHFMNLPKKQIKQIQKYYRRKGERKNTIVELVADELSDTNSIRITDFGVGISPLRAKGIYRKFFGSTKRKSSNQIGGWGLGSKSPLSYTDIFMCTTVFNGICYEYMIRKGERKPILDTIDKWETDDENQTIIEVPIETKADYFKFITAIKQQLAYFDQIEYRNCGIDNDYQIIRGKHFIYRPNNDFRQLHLCLDKIYYPIDFNQLGRYSSVDCPIGLYFSIEEVEEHIRILEHRENIQYTAETIDAIKTKMGLAREELRTLLKKHVKYPTTLKQYYDTSNTTDQYYITPDVTIPGLNRFTEVSDIENPPVKKYVDIGFPTDPLFFLQQKAWVNWDGKRYADAWERIEKPALMGRKTMSNLHLYMQQGTHASPTKEKYMQFDNNDTPLVVFQERSLQKFDEELKWWLINVFPQYRHQGFVSTDPSINWKLMAEFIQEAKETWVLNNKQVVVYEDIEVPQEYLDLLKEEAEKKKAEQKERRKRRENEVTLRILQKSDRTSARKFSDFYEFKMNYRKEGELEDFRGMMIYGSNADTDKLIGIAPFFFIWEKLKDGWYTLDPKKIMIVKIAQGNQKFVEHMKNAVHVDEFLLLEHARMAKYVRYYFTADKLRKILGSKLYERYPFMDEYGSPTMTNEVSDAMKEVAPRMWHTLMLLYSLYDQFTTVNSNSNSDHQLPDEIVAFFEEYEKQRLIQKRKAKKRGISFHSISIYDHDTIQTAEELIAYFEKYPLLFHVKENTPKEEIVAYLKKDLELNPLLLRRVRKYSEKNKLTEIKLALTKEENNQRENAQKKEA